MQWQIYGRLWRYDPSLWITGKGKGNSFWLVWINGKLIRLTVFENCDSCFVCITRWPEMMIKLIKLIMPVGLYRYNTCKCRYKKRTSASVELTQTRHLGRWTHRGKSHVGRHCSYTYKIWCGSVHALLRYRSKTTRMQKFSIDSYLSVVLCHMAGLSYDTIKLIN